MKKHTLLLALLVFISLAFTAPADQLFSTQEIVWCGLDFSEVKLIGAEGFSNPEDVKERFFDSWNQLVLDESNKYNIQKFYQKERQINDLSVVNSRNSLPAASELLIEGKYLLNKEQLANIIKTYQLEMASEGVAVVYVVESLNKTALEAMVHVVFFDISSREILWTKRYSAPPRGFGLRNYWAYAFYQIMKTSGKQYQAALKTYQKANKVKQRSDRGIKTEI